MADWLIPGIIGGVGGGLVVLLIALFMPRPKCPGCGEQMPRFRKPANRRQMLWGGWTCSQCGCEVDRRGNKVEDGVTPPDFVAGEIASRGIARNARHAVEIRVEAREVCEAVTLHQDDNHGVVHEQAETAADIGSERNVRSLHRQHPHADRAYLIDSPFVPG